MRKKYLCAALASMMLIGCGSGGGGTETETKKSNDAYYEFTLDPATLDYTITQNGRDIAVSFMAVDGLVELNANNEWVPCLAESLEHNEDSTEWTFHIRKGVKWVTNTGEEYAELKAQDFVTGMQHATEFNAAAFGLVSGLIVNLQNYKDGLCSWEDVGVKATDDYTLVYTLTQSATYFDSMTQYTIFHPINEEFLNSQGAGCKLGSPDQKNCNFGNVTDLTSILYNGPYIINSLVSKSEQKYTKNEAYWDADNVHIEHVNLVYDDQSDPAFTVKNFEADSNPFYMATLLTTAPDFQSYLDKYKDYAFNGQQSIATWGLTFNLNRIMYGKTPGGANTTDKTEAQQADTRTAVLNTNFRLALKFGLDRISYMSVAIDPSIAAAALRNTLDPYTYVKTSDGTMYGKLVQEASTLGDYDLSEGQDPFYDPAKAKEYMEKAKAELTSVSSWPIHLDILVNETSSTSVAQAASMKNSVEASVGADNVYINIIPVSDDDYESASYDGPEEAGWDISTDFGWSGDYVDPLTYVHCFSPVDGDMIMYSLGLTFEGDGDEQNSAAIKASGLDEFQTLLEEANAINTDLDARYEAFAKSEAYLLDNALFIPTQTTASTVNWKISREVPFLGAYNSTTKYKWRIINDDPITKEEYDAAYKKWLANQ